MDLSQSKNDVPIKFKLKIKSPSIIFGKFFNKDSLGNVILVCLFFNVNPYNWYDSSLTTGWSSTMYRQKIVYEVVKRNFYIKHLY